MCGVIVNVMEFSVMVGAPLCGLWMPFCGALALALCGVMSMVALEVVMVVVESKKQSSAPPRLVTAPYTSVRAMRDPRYEDRNI